ncbi:MAG: hypothetical protein JST04_14605 [Bdellovibrionales bacterium]|nr:hypothetical protein [Bdellovibrionales bacterium]
MRLSTILGFFIGIMGFACAPVASSVPKLSTASPRTVDSIVNNGNVDLRVLPVKVEVVTSDQASTLRARYKADGYDVDTNKYDDRDDEFSQLKELHAINDLSLPAKLNRAEVVFLFTVKGSEKSIRQNVDDALKINPLRGEMNVFSFSISLEGDSAEAWSYVKQNVIAVTIASREARKKQ